MMNARAQMIDLENRFWQTMLDKDVDTAVDLMADTCIVTGAQGAASIDKQAFAKMMAEGKWQLQEFKLEDIEFNSPTSDVGIIAYKVTEKVTVDGKEIAFTAADSSVWIKRNGKWLCALHTESILGDPFGRDKAAPPQ